MSHQEDQEDQEDSQPELQPPIRPVAYSPHNLAILQAAAMLTIFLYYEMVEYVTGCCPTPYHTSSLSGSDWVQELLSGHPECIWTELGVHQGTFILLIKSLQMLGLQSLCHVSIEEQLSIFLYTMVTGLPCTHVGECFQQSSDTITK
jgi:hypothetical protein